MESGMIDVRNLSKSYGGFQAVKGISFSVAEGEIVGFLGPNGAGKTTTIRILTCYHPADAGEAKIAGHDVFNESMQVRQVIGYLPESVPLYHEMRVREFLHFRGRLHDMDREQRTAAIARVAERCWIRDVIDRPIGQLSKGYRQRVGLADALLHNPKVLILDEPTVGLDPTQIRETRSLIRELAQDHTVMLSSHILPEVEATCKRLVIIAKGSIVASGTPDELRKRIAGDASAFAELKAPESELQKALSGLDGVQTVKLETRDGWVRAQIAARHDVRERVARLAGEKNWPLRELRSAGGSLEDFFVKIVAGAAANAD
jgi:ABC-2 type transport system ATP-binding protein